MLENEILVAQAEARASSIYDSAGLQVFFAEFFKDRPLLEARFPRTDAGELGWLPEIDVRETAEEIVIHVSVPGVEKHDLRLEISQDGLKISGRRQPRESGGGWLRREIVAGPFERHLPLPTSVRAGLARASHRDGVLEIRVPKQLESPVVTLEIQ